ncbi:MAG: sulfatase [Sphingomonadaceae bacterium]
MTKFTLDRRQVLIGSTATLAGAAFTTSLKAGANELPNIIFIMADDLGYADLGCTGSRMNQTPHIDSLRLNGMFFPQGYSNSAICSPTRTALLTGCYQQRFQIGLEEPVGPGLPDGLGVPFERETLPELLRAQGYETALVGKWHLGNPPVNNPLNHGYDHFFGIIPGGVDYFRHHAIIGGRNLGVGLMEGNEEVQRTGYLTDVFGDEAVRLIREKSKPLFLSLHFTAPHWPWEGWEDEEVAKKIKDFRHFDGGSLETYANMVAALDDNVGKVLAALRETGEFDNTIVIFTSDNGGERFSDTWPFIGVKGELLEGGIRVPVLMQWPDRISAGSTSSQVIMSMDFLPSLIAIAGGQLPEATYDGLDLSSHILARTDAIQRTLFWRLKNANQAAVRHGDWKYIKLGSAEHLFNLAADPRERADRKDSEPVLFRELRDLWNSWNAKMLPYPIESYSHDNREYFTDRY